VIRRVATLPEQIQIYKAFIYIYMTKNFNNFVGPDEYIQYLGSYDVL
jgi:hypothetical protein